MTESNLISIKEAATLGIERLRRPIWATPEDHLKIDIINGRVGPWLHLYCPFNKECNGRDPVDFLIIQEDIESKEWLPYNGTLPDSDEYKAMADAFDGVLARSHEPIQK